MGSLSYERFVCLVESNLLPCSIRQLTGQECPGCGFQRAFVELLRGDLVASLQANPGLLFFVITLGYALLHLKFSFKSGPSVVLWLFVSTVSLMIANYIGRLAHLW